MELRFTKMHGCGNDYIYCFGEPPEPPDRLSVLLSDRHKGVGGDGLVLILPSEIADARMRMFNIDGSEGAMCGNAIRCVAKYLYDNDIVRKSCISVETMSGVKDLEVFVQDGAVTSVRVNMGVAEAGAIELGDESAVYVDVGNPHCVLFREGLEEIDISLENYEKDTRFPGGVNTEFVEVLGRDCLKMRVWERGSGETQACGTGACAAVAASVLRGYCDAGTDVRVMLPGGDLIINYTKNAVYMTGNCVKVFEGIAEL